MSGTGAVSLTEAPAPTVLRDGGLSVLAPSSAVLVGASPATATVVANALRGNVPVWGVHPRHRNVGALTLVPSVADLPACPELAVLLVGHRHAETVFEEVVSVGVRAVLVPGLGAEAGSDGPPVVARLAARAAALGVALVGPNCMGTARPDGPSFWLGSLPSSFLTGRISVVAQSGSVAEALVTLGPRIGFRHVVSTGGEAVRDAADVLAWLADDPATNAIGLFLEAVRRPAAFACALGLAARAGKPIVCLKVGRSQAAARAAIAHSGALVGSDRALSALLDAYGVIEVDDVPDLCETLELLGSSRRPRGRRLAGVSESGGEAALLADQAEAAGIPVASLSDAVKDRLRDEFPNFVAVENPVDAWAIDEPDRVFPRTLELLARSGEVDILVAQIDLGAHRGKAEQRWCAMVVRALGEVARDTGVLPVVTTVHTSDPPDHIAALARDLGVPLLRGLGAAMRALAAVAAWHPRTPRTSDDHAAIEAPELDRSGVLPEFESGAVLERHGVPIAPRRRAATPDEAAWAAAQLGFPVVVKRDGPAHKAVEDGVVLGVDDPAAVANAAQRLGGPVLVARQMPAGVETFCGLVRDPDFGPIVTVGLGGRAVEALGLTAVALAPLDLEHAQELVSDAPGLATLATPRALEQLATIVVAVARLAVDHPRVKAVDVNPVILGEDKAIAVDALIELA
ncbi:MAG: acetate--CoA ligase family protein [Solirubrobacteraceae bacterium]